MKKFYFYGLVGNFLCFFLIFVTTPAVSESSENIESHLKVEKDELEKLRKKIERNNKRISSKGTYTSVSIRVKMQSPISVIEKYQEVSEIEGVISL